MAFKTFDPEIAARKQKNADIFRETTRLIKAGGYTTPSGKQIQFDFTRMLQQGKCFQQEIPAISASLVEGGTKVIVECNDCLVAAGRLVNEGYNPVLLNFASAGHPGGGVETGARAQEETICRRSTLTRSIYSFDAKYASRYGYALQAGEHYPIVSEFSAVYSPAVTVFREGIDCLFMEEPYDVAVVTCAALNLNGKYPIKLTPDGHMPQTAIDITRNKIQTVFRIGLTYGHDSLVLGAFGCGAFKNPPAEIVGSKGIKVIDYNEPEKTGLQKSNVLQFFNEDGDIVSVRPSGTEPKIKFYFGAKGPDADAKLKALEAQFIS